jgi:hypothetical protein
MAKLEFPADLQKKIEESRPIDLLVGITGSVDPEELRTRAIACIEGLGGKVVVAYAGVTEPQLAEPLPENIQLVSYPPPPANSLALLLDMAAAQRSVLALAEAWQARACIVIDNDLAALKPDAVRLFLQPVLEGKSDLVMPVYPDGKYDRLLNKALLAPLSRALYGRRVRSPLSFDFCAGAKVIAELSSSLEVRSQNEPQLLWPANVVALNGNQIGQAAVNIEHSVQADAMDLSAVLTELAGSLFQEAETDAAYWQRVRGSQPVPRFGDPLPAREDAQPIDPRPLVESFVLGSRNLEEVWRLVLPPATMLELRRLARLEPEKFRMPDDLWARIVYDFALAHRMRRVSRTHVLGALTPLYLGWVASYTQEVGGATAHEAGARIEQLARVFEEQKPYFVSRWRWPQRVS